MYSFHQYKKFCSERQIALLNRDGVPLDLACTSQSDEVVLFAYNDFYVELGVATHSDEIVFIRCFRSVKKLEPYLRQIDIDEITALLMPGSES
ncbi:MAG TPA: hypothetical protein VER36_00765 [Flavisolibacter sp.]|nr:hypothetical protein [Flavisolibacter sp.]